MLLSPIEDAIVEEHKRCSWVRKWALVNKNDTAISAPSLATAGSSAFAKAINANATPIACCALTTKVRGSEGHEIIAIGASFSVKELEKAGWFNNPLLNADALCTPNYKNSDIIEVFVAEKYRGLKKGYSVKTMMMVKNIMLGADPNHKIYATLYGRSAPRGRSIMNDIHVPNKGCMMLVAESKDVVIELK